MLMRVLSLLTVSCASTANPHTGSPVLVGVLLLIQSQFSIIIILNNIINNKLIIKIPNSQTLRERRDGKGKRACGVAAQGYLIANSVQVPGYFPQTTEATSHCSI